MSRANLNQTSFTAGELSPRTLGRVDIDRYFQGMKRALNGYATPQGGFRSRFGSAYLGAASTASANGSILVPFVAGSESRWMLEFSHALLRIWNADGTLSGTSIVTPWTAGDLDSLDWAQDDATMWLFSPTQPIMVLRRLGSGTWVLDEAAFTTQPFAELGVYASVSITLSSATVGVGRTATASGATFLASDVGRGLIYDAGIAVITGYTSTTQVTVEITRAFSSTAMPSGQWTMEGSPQTTCTPSAKDPVGVAITLTAGAAAWRSRDVGAFVLINGGLCQITGITSDTVADAKIVTELVGTVAAPSLAWSLQHAAWGGPYGYPRTGTVYQQRLICGGTTRFPRTYWASRSGEQLDFQIGTSDDMAFGRTISSDESTPIVYITSSPDLLVLTESGEYSVRAGIEKGLTPTGVRDKQESGHGTATVRPCFVNGETIFVQRAGRKVRSLAWRYDFDRYASSDITALSDHITAGGVTCMAWQQEADPLLWAVRGDGKFLTCAIDRDQQPSVVGWTLNETDGAVEWVATLPDEGSDQVWVIVRRTVGGATVRYVERFDSQLVAVHPSVSSTGPVFGLQMDAAKVFDSAIGESTFSVPHLVGREVEILADGLVMPRQTVPGGGSITLPRAGKRVVIGLPFRTEATLLTPEFGTQSGSSQGSAMRTGKVSLRFTDTGAATVRNAEGRSQVISFQRFGADLLDQPPELFSGLKDVTALGWGKGFSELTIVRELPLPMHLLSVMRRHTANDG